MSTKNLSYFDKTDIPDAKHMRIGIVVSEWNAEITDNLLKGCLETLSECGATLDNLQIVHVPGSFELPSAAQFLMEHTRVEGVICLGCVIRGETPHFDFICQACADGVNNVAIKYVKPVIFGVLTDNTIDQSRARSGGSLGNKGIEAAITAIKMIALQKELRDNW
ncbi:MAG: 6,7-dimethyl-8-ribityllumazine synthase [Flavobacteriales bacterium]|nr:6,7-dimethyl-8-ribityllumazine synthase [Flavobacteriales bacterium]